MATLDFHPLMPERWDDFERLFGPRGACGGCWCMWWRLRYSDFERLKGEGTRKLMQASVQRGEVPGLLAYADGEPVGWCAVAPRESYSTLERSRILKPVDDTPVWSIVCFYVAKAQRRQGLTVQLLGAAIEYVRAQGGQVLEGYPVEPKEEKMPDAFAYTGLVSAFRQAGFVEVARRSARKPIMRKEVKG